MNTPTENIVITVMASGTTVPDVTTYSNRVAYRGEVVEITPSMYEGTVDREGNSWLDQDEAAQVRRYGKVRFRVGDHSHEIDFIGDDDSTVVYKRRENAEIAARKLSDVDERVKALKAVNERYGPAQSTQRSEPYL